MCLADQIIFSERHLPVAPGLMEIGAVTKCVEVCALERASADAKNLWVLVLAIAREDAVAGDVRRRYQWLRPTGLSVARAD